MIEITMPKAGQSMEDGTIVRWCKAEGDLVTAGEILLEVETDKANVEIEAADSGTLRKILVAQGETVPVLTPIALLGDPDEDISAAMANLAATQQAPAEPQTAVQTGQEAPAAPAPEGAVTPVLMPKAGQSVEEATIVKWNVQSGAKIAEGDIIFEIETDKATVEVEATDSGRLARIVADEGATVAVLEPVAYLAENDADVDAYIASQPASSAAEPPTPAAATPPAPAPAPVAPTQRTVSGEGRVKASPAARRIAKERGIDLAAVASGTGPGGRIISTDVPAVAPGRPGAADAPTAQPAPPVATPAGEAVRTPLKGMRKAIAKNLLASKQNIPHFYMRMTLDAGGMQDFYRAAKGEYPCSINDVVTLACARAIHEFPAFRSRVDGNDIVEMPTSNIGIAVGIEDGLVVPVLVNAERLSLAQLAGETKRIVAAARGGKIEGMGQGVFTITNLGMFGVEEFAAIINPPEAAILAVSAIREDVVVRDGAIRPGRVMTVTLSVDHRVVDGLVAAKFLARLKELLEVPQLMM